jgi:DegV family protein with EDD domain
MQEAAARAAEVGERLHLYAVVPTLKYLALSGRVGKLMAGMADTLDIKPVLTVRDGSLVLLEKVRTRKKAVERMLGLVRQALAGSSIERLAIIHVNNEADALTLQKQICADYAYTGPVIVAPFTPGLSVHAGSGVVGVVIQSR